MPRSTQTSVQKSEIFNFQFCARTTCVVCIFSPGILANNTNATTPACVKIIIIGARLKIPRYYHWIIILFLAESGRLPQALYLL